jgi:hypothetical protein
MKTANHPLQGTRSGCRGCNSRVPRAGSLSLVRWLLRPRMRFSILLSYLVAFTISDAAFGACLEDDYSVAAEYARSVAVVQARVISERNVPDPGAPKFIGGTIYKVRVEESFHGALHGTVEVFSENSSGRFPMEKRKSYLLFLYREEGRLSADPCGNSGFVSQKTNDLAKVRALSKAAHTDQKPKSLQPTRAARSVHREAVGCFILQFPRG